MSRKYGARYDASLSTPEIAKRVRRDIEDEQRAGAIPREVRVSVTTQRYSMGTSLTVRVKAVPPAFRFVNAAHLRPPPVGESPAPRYTPEGAALLRKLESIVGAYNHDGSDPQTDYYDVKFSQHVGYDLALEEGHRALAMWEAEAPGGSFCGNADPLAYCGKPLVRGCDFHDHMFVKREATHA